MVQLTRYSDFALAPINPKHVVSMAMVCVLVACGAGDGDDLDKFIREAGKDMHVKIPPIPEVKPYAAVDYNADGTLVDPFKPRKAIAKGGIAEPDLKRAREPLEGFPLQSLKYVGVLENAKLKYALIRTPENVTQQVRVGGYMGQDFGKVIAITETEIKLKETVQDDASGDWVERAASLSLQE